MTTTPLQVAIQMDAMETVNIHFDSSFALALEAQSRGFDLWHYTVDDLTYNEGKVQAYAHPVSGNKLVEPHRKNAW